MLSELVEKWLTNRKENYFEEENPSERENKSELFIAQALAIITICNILKKKEITDGLTNRHLTGPQRKKEQETTVSGYLWRDYLKKKTIGFWQTCCTHCCHLSGQGLAPGGNYQGLGEGSRGCHHYRHHHHTHHPARLYLCLTGSCLSPMDSYPLNPDVHHHHCVVENLNSVTWYTQAQSQLHIVTHYLCIG